MIAVRTLSAIISLYGCFLLYMLSALGGTRRRPCKEKFGANFSKVKTSQCDVFRESDYETCVLIQRQ